MTILTLTRGPLPDSVWEHSTPEIARKHAHILRDLHNCESTEDEQGNITVNADSYYTRRPMRI